MTATASGRTPARRRISETATPSQRLSYRLQRVTQWMSDVTSTRGSPRNSFHVQETSLSTRPKHRKVQVCRSARGVSPYVRTGHFCVSTCPGGRRSLASVPFISPAPSHPSLIGLYERDIDEMFRDEPDLLFVAADDIRDKEVIRPVVAGLGRLAGHGTRLLEHDLVRVEEPRDLHRHLLAPLRRPWDDRRLGHIGRHGEADASEHLDPLGNRVDQVVLLFVMLVE